ncbi:hypothetical protein ABK040_001018 [Willaertia magna]
MKANRLYKPQHRETDDYKLFDGKDDDNNTTEERMRIKDDDSLEKKDEKPKEIEEIKEKEIFLLNQFPTEIEVKFITNTYPIKVADTPFKLPSNFTRFGLSEVINQLIQMDGSNGSENIQMDQSEEENLNLENSNVKHVPFEFLIEYKPGKKIFLRTSLAKFFTKLQLWPESVITLEYMEAQPSPKSVDTIPHDDWVSCISLIQKHLNTPQEQIYVVSGCYDGVIRIIDGKEGQIIHQTKQASIPITAIHTTLINSHHLSNETLNNTTEYKIKENDLLIAGCGKDEFGRVWISSPNEKLIRMKMLLNGHTDILNDICFNPKGNMICTASEDKSIKLWEVDLFKAKKIEPIKKKKKSVPSQIQQYAAIGTLERNEKQRTNGHLLGVTCLEWMSGGKIISGSSDHTIRLWDVTTGNNVTTLNGSKVVSDLSTKNGTFEENVVLSAHPDFLIRMWDIRQNGSKKASLFRSHKGWVRSVKWLSEFQFISGGDDNAVKLWDIRSGIPIHSMPHSVNEERTTICTDKVLAVDGYCYEFGNLGKHSKYGLFSGSTDCTLKKHVMSD